MSSSARRRALTMAKPTAPLKPTRRKRLRRLAKKPRTPEKTSEQRRPRDAARFSTAQELLVVSRAAAALEAANETRHDVLADQVRPVFGQVFAGLTCSVLDHRHDGPSRRAPGGAHHRRHDRSGVTAAAVPSAGVVVGRAVVRERLLGCQRRRTTRRSQRRCANDGPAPVVAVLLLLLLFALFALCHLSYSVSRLWLPISHPSRGSSFATGRLSLCRGPA